MSAALRLVESPFASAWRAFGCDLTGLGLARDLLPVPQPGTPVSPSSRVRGPGKVPGRINPQGFATGFPGWTSHETTEQEIEQWSRDPRLGVCLQTRRVRGIDIDVDEPAAAQAIEDFVVGELGQALPCRTRSNSGKRLLLVAVPGEIGKQVLPVAGGAVELLGNGQQAVIAGTHPSGVHYEWRGGLPDAIPEISAGCYAELVAALRQRFGVGDAVSIGGELRKRDASLAIDDPFADWLYDRGLVLADRVDGGMNVACPWEHEHTTPTADDAAVYFPAGTNGYDRGNFKCLHGHCAGRDAGDYEQAVGYVADDFAVLPPLERAATQGRFKAVPADEFANGPPPRWLVKGVLPQAALGVVYGASGAGKSFFVLDLAAAVALGVPWRGARVKQANVLYVCAEGAGGFRSRVLAYRQERAATFGDTLHVVAGQPNFLTVDDPAAIIAEARRVGAGLVVVDTLAQVTPGGDENSAADMGKALKQCQRLHEATGALVLLVHHAGKDAAKGARGWSGLRAACDVEIEVAMVGEGRTARTTKMKDGRDDGEYGFKLVPVAVGVDADGDEIVSCVVAEADPPTRTAPPPRGVAGVVWNVLLECLNTPGGEVVALGDLLDRVVDRMEPSEDGKKDRRRDNARRGCEKLQIEGLIAIDGGNVSLVCGSTIPDEAL